MLCCLFSNVSKIHDPSPLQLQKCNRGKNDTQTKMVSYDWEILDKTFTWLQILTYITSAYNSPSSNFLPIWLVTIACHKIAHTVSPNHLGQIQLPWTSMPLMTSFHHLQFHRSIWMQVGQMLWRTFSNVSKIHDPSPLPLPKCNRRKYDTQTKMVSYDSGHSGYNQHMTPDCDLYDLCPQLTFN